MIFKDIDGGIHFVHGGHHKSFPPHPEDGTQMMSAAAARSRSSRGSPKPHAEKRKQGSGSSTKNANGTHRQHRQGTAVHLSGDEMAATLASGASLEPDEPYTMTRTASSAGLQRAVSASRLPPPSHTSRPASRSSMGAGSESDPDGGGGSAFGTISNPHSPTTAGGGGGAVGYNGLSFDAIAAVEIRDALNSVPLAHLFGKPGHGLHASQSFRGRMGAMGTEIHSSSSSNDDDNGSHDESHDEDVDPAKAPRQHQQQQPPLSRKMSLHLPQSLTAPPPSGAAAATGTHHLATHATKQPLPPASGNDDAWACLGLLSRVYKIDSEALLRCALDVEVRLGLREADSPLSTPTTKSLSHFHDHHHVGSSHSSNPTTVPVSVKEIGPLFRSSEEDLLDVFRSLGAHDPDDTVAAAAAAQRFAAISRGGVGGGAAPPLLLGASVNVPAPPPPPVPSVPFAASGTSRSDGGLPGSPTTVHSAAISLIQQQQAKQHAARGGSGGRAAPQPAMAQMLRALSRSSSNHHTNNNNNNNNSTEGSSAGAGGPHSSTHSTIGGGDGDGAISSAREFATLRLVLPLPFLFIEPCFVPRPLLFFCCSKWRRWRGSG